MRRVALVVATAVIAAGCGGSGHKAVRTTSTQAAHGDLNGPLPDTRISIRGSARAVRRGEPVTIDGTVVRDGKPAARIELRLLKHDGKTPVGTRDEVAKTATDTAGHYRFVVRPKRSGDWNVETSLAEASALLPVTVAR